MLHKILFEIYSFPQQLCRDLIHILLYIDIFIYLVTLELETVDQEETIEQGVATDSCFQNRTRAAFSIFTKLGISVSAIFSSVYF